MVKFLKPKRKCDMCKRKMNSSKVYFLANGEKKIYCLACSEYAERRAYRKL